MACPFRVVIIVLTAAIALLAAILALRSPTEIDEQGEEVPTRSIKQHMSDWYDGAVRPWIPSSLGGCKSVIVEDDRTESSSSNEDSRLKAD